MTSLLFRHGEVDGRSAEVRVDHGRIVEVATTLTPRADEEVIDVAGGAILAGLHDHHLHLVAMAAARRSVTVGPPVVNDHAAMSAVLRSASVAVECDGGWIRGVGYHEHVAGDLGRDALDAIVGHRPVRIQHRSGALWMLNTEALRRIGLTESNAPEGAERDVTGRLTGRLWRLDGWLAGRIDAESPPDLASVGETLARHGITGVTDATPTATAAGFDPILDAAARGTLPQRVTLTGAPGLRWAPPAGIEQGPVKVLLADHVDPSLDDLIDAVRAAREQGRAVAIHAVTAVGAALAVAAIEAVGPMRGDRIEHGAVVPRRLEASLAALGIAVVTNPGFVVARGDQYLTDVEAAEQPDLWRCASLLDAGVAVAAGTDAPFGPDNPWVAIAAAAERLSASGRAIAASEAIAPRRALELFLGGPEDPGGPPRRVEAGAPADLCVLGEPLREALANPAHVRPRATVIGGRVWDWST